MKAHPILFKSEMVQAILDGRKAQTRRVVQTTRSWVKFYGGDKDAATKAFHKDASIWNCGGQRGPHWQESDEWLLQNYQEGDHLWVKETYLVKNAGRCIVHRASMDAVEAAGFGALYGGWKSSMFMPRRASRITLEILSVCVGRLQDISPSDCAAEGIQRGDDGSWLGPSLGVPDFPYAHAHEAYAGLWDSINRKKHPWSSNPLVFVISFKKINES